MSDDDSNDPSALPSAAEEPAPPVMGEGPWGSLRPATDLPSAAATRHDGWTGPLMAQFCETLAETGIVVDACLAVGKSTNTAYANCRRDPLFAVMWEAALGIARNRLADALLARSIEGSVEHYYRDGELVGEKRHIDNRLGLAVLRRLDRLMETGSPLSCRDLPLSVRQSSVLLRRQESSSTLTGSLPAQGSPPPLDWDQMIGALRTRDPDAMAVALAALRTHEKPVLSQVEGPETHETHDPPESPTPAPEDDDIEDPTNSVWQSHEDWWTDYPPPAGFEGVEHGQWGSRDYRRTCTAEERALMEAVTTLQQSEMRAAQEADRTAYFADVAAELAEAMADDDETAS